MFGENEREALQAMQFNHVIDLWDDNARSPWAPNEVHDGFTRSAGYNTHKLKHMLGGESDFATRWNKLLDEVPRKWWQLLETEDHQISEGEHFAYNVKGVIHYALLVDADLRSIIPCEITTKGILHELEEIEELPEEMHAMKILYDNRGRVVGAEESSYPRWHDWKLKIGADKHKRASTVKINHIYKALIKIKQLSPNCEANWNEQRINPPLGGGGKYGSNSMA